MTTVLPNPKPHCYSRNFPKVPDSEWGAGYFRSTYKAAVQDHVLSTVQRAPAVQCEWPSRLGSLVPNLTPLSVPKQTGPSLCASVSAPSAAAAATTLWWVSAVAVGRSCAALGGMRACRLPPRLFWKKQTCRPPLQISGHGVVYAVVALALHDFFPAPLWRWGPRTLGWLALIKLCIQVRAASSHNIHITQFC